MDELLNIDLFTRINTDTEMRQYRILAALQKARREFQRNRIYPHLAELVNLFNTLRSLVQHIGDMKSDFPQEITRINLENKTIEKRVILVDGSRIDRVQELIEWALPHIRDVIEEGISVYEFVDENLSIEKVGIVPEYREEGYFFVPDNTEKQLLLFQFEVTLFESAEDRYRALKTFFLKKVGLDNLRHTPAELKLSLIRELKKLPNPITFSCTTPLALPFKETVFPVAKRKLLRYLYN